MLMTIMTREMSGRSRTVKVFGLCVWTNSSSFLRLDGHRLGIAPSILSWGTVGSFRQVVFSAAMTYTLTHVWRFRVV